MSQSNESLGVVEGDEKELFKAFQKQQCPDLDTKQSLEYFLACKSSGLNPARGEIYYIMRGNRMAIQTSIDGFRSAAAASGRYNGQTETLWCDNEGNWKDVWTDRINYPYAAKIGVYIQGIEHPTYATAHFHEYYPKPSQNSKSMPALMIAKCAEALALRKALPERLSRIYTSDEMKQADREESPAGTATTPPKKGAAALAQQIKDVQAMPPAGVAPEVAEAIIKGDNPPHGGIEGGELPEAPEQLTPEEETAQLSMQEMQDIELKAAMKKFDEDPTKELFLEAMRQRGHKNKAIQANFKAWLMKYAPKKKQMDDLTPKEMMQLIVQTRLGLVEDDIPF